MEIKLNSAGAECRYTTGILTYATAEVNYEIEE